MATAEPRQKMQMMGTDGTNLVDLALCSSGEVIVCSGLHVVADVEVVASSGLWVDGVSGVHVYVESGVSVVGEITAGMSGQKMYLSGLLIHIGCADEIRTGFVDCWQTGSGGQSLCSGYNISGWFCSGLVHSVILKSMSGNDIIFVGDVNCKPYSGHGFALAESEAVTLDVCKVCDVYVCPNASGQYVTFIATDY